MNRQDANKRILALLAGVSVLSAGGLAGCSAEVASSKEGFPKDWRVISTPGNYMAFVVPVTLEDGTKCIVVTANSAGRGITCDWRKDR